MRLKAPIRKFLERERVVRVATTGRGGVPHVVPVCHVLEDGKIYFATDLDSKKAKNLRTHRQAAVELDLYSEDWDRLVGAVITGPATLIEGGPRFRKLRRLLYRKYPQYPEESPLEEGEVVMVEVVPHRLVSWGLD
jgi:PPOX class probable F420-dependent enzyme